MSGWLLIGVADEGSFRKWCMVYGVSRGEPSQMSEFRRQLAHNTYSSRARTPVLRRPSSLQALPLSELCSDHRRLEVALRERITGRSFRAFLDQPIEALSHWRRTDFLMLTPKIQYLMVNYVHMYVFI